MNDWDIYIRFIPLPPKVEGITHPNNDGTFSIYINCNACKEQQKLTINHELMHIKKDHFYDYEPVVYNEKEAHIAI